MTHKTTLTLIPLIGLMLFISFPAFGGYMEHYGITECFHCHFFDEDPYPQNPEANLDWVLTTIATPNSGDRQVIYINREGSNSLADGDTVYDGACEVCHTQTAYHNNLGTSVYHFDGSRCTACHDHFPGAGRDWFSPELPGPQSHDTHLHSKKGPKVSECIVCHDSMDMAVFADGNPLESTTVCDGCHSPSGQYDGVNDTVLGAKLNWNNGIYEPGGNALVEGKEGWCLTCHDAGESTIKNVLAPNVAGDNVSYGFNVSGHGKLDIQKTCLSCHMASEKHMDGTSRSYAATEDNYQKGYRLGLDMHVPRYNTFGPEDFDLCLSCHDYERVFGELSNFRDDAKRKQFHFYHLSELFASIYSWDSDIDGAVDSVVSCTACHNVHGSPSPSMIRHGELISTPGTTDKVPALDFRWYVLPPDEETTILQESRYGSLLCGAIGDLDINHVCYGCHTSGRIEYNRTPKGVPVMTIDGVTTKNTSGDKQSSFLPGESIRYQVKFTITGTSDYHVEAEGWAFNKTGKDWASKFSKKKLLSPGTHKWKWNRTVPLEAKPGSKATLRIVLRMYDELKSTLLLEEEKTKKFRIKN